MDWMFNVTNIFEKSRPTILQPPYIHIEMYPIMRGGSPIFEPTKHPKPNSNAQTIRGVICVLSPSLPLLLLHSEQIGF